MVLGGRAQGSVCGTPSPGWSPQVREDGSFPRTSGNRKVPAEVAGPPPLKADRSPDTDGLRLSLSAQAVSGSVQLPCPSVSCAVSPGELSPGVPSGTWLLTHGADFPPPVSLPHALIGPLRSPPKYIPCFQVLVWTLVDQSAPLKSGIRGRAVSSGLHCREAGLPQARPGLAALPGADGTPLGSSCCLEGVRLCRPPPICPALLSSSSPEPDS